MALSVSFSFKWEPTAPRIMSDDWVKKTLEGRERTAQEQAFQAEKMNMLASKMRYVFSTLMARVQSDVKGFRSSGDFSELRFNEDNAAQFTVENLVFPAVTIEVRMGSYCFPFTMRRTPNSTTQTQVREGLIDLSLDDKWNVVMKHNGKLLPNVSDASKLLIGPAVRLEESE